ncbi:DUF1629 domain-containing protein [Bradyrhizobium sp. Pear76]|uniref:imm11 family protein n=1 Tax=Bradyrhizobium oropedii TaxID=1571201 RepID=UPI001E5DF9E9|nr:DUF1629 domain-containing protein [Bradyrhizobium oropedii]MCC8967957.1 DUF1629 domain-containing protein [Bradyrhizobium oropedii]
MNGDKPKQIDRRAKQLKRRRFYQMSFDYRRGGLPGYLLQNRETLVPGEKVLLAPAGRRGFPAYPVRPHFLLDRKAGRLPRDLEMFNDYWLVSDQTKAVFQAVDHSGFDFFPCDVSLPEDEYQGPAYWLCDVVRILDALDEAESRLKIFKRGEPDYRYIGDKFYDIAGGARLVFKEDAIGAAHVFRMAYRMPTIICDDVLKDACKAAGLRGIKFRDALEL